MLPKLIDILTTSGNSLAALPSRLRTSFTWAGLVQDLLCSSPAGSFGAEIQLGRQWGGYGREIWKAEQVPVHILQEQSVRSDRVKKTQEYGMYNLRCQSVKEYEHESPQGEGRWGAHRIRIYSSKSQYSSITAVSRV